MNKQELLTRLATDKPSIQAIFSQERIENCKMQIAELQKQQEIFELLSSNGIDTLLDCSAKMAAYELIQKSQMDICKKIFSFAGSPMEIATVLAKGNTPETQEMYNALEELNKSLETYPLVYDFTEKKEFDNGLIRLENKVSQKYIGEAWYVQKRKNPQWTYELREVFPMRSVRENREFLKNMDSDGIILGSLNGKYGITFYLAELGDEGKINVKVVNRIEGRWGPFNFVDGEFYIRNEQYGDVIVKKTFDEKWKFVELKFFQHRKLLKDKEIFF